MSESLEHERYLYELGPHRERVANQRWLFWHAGEFLAALGLPFGWWCAVGLLRRQVFGQNHDGDVDLLAGPLELNVSRDEWAVMLRDTAESRPGWSPSMVRGLAVHDACEKGFVAWPPPIGFSVGVEVKASWFDGEKWKATHAGEGRRIAGQLRVLHDRDCSWRVPPARR
jgi:hypothetical protein